MDSKDETRLLDLSCKWQQKVTWENAREAAELFEEKRRQSSEIDEVCHKHVVNAHRELHEFANLLRQHAPKLLKLVPVVNFFLDDWNGDDVAGWVRQMRELEGEFRVLFDEPATDDDPQASVEQRALAVLVNHPDWTVKRIALEVSATREYLSSKSCPKFKAARAAIRESSIPAGTKTKTGEMEAAGDDDLDFDAMDARMKPKSKR